MQVNKLNLGTADDPFDAKILETDIPGRSDALTREQIRVDNFAANNNGKGPQGNILPEPTLPSPNEGE